MTKPDCKLTETDGNVFAIIAEVTRCLREHGLRGSADEFRAKAFKAQSYDKVLQLCMEYVEVY